MSQIKELKAIVGQSAEQTIAQGLGLEKKGKKYRCPNKTAHKNGDKNPSMAWDPSALQMKCFACDFKLDIYGYMRDYEHLSHYDILQRYGLAYSEKVPVKANRQHQEQTEKKSMEFTMSELTANQKKYLLGRGIQESFCQVFCLGNATGSFRGHIAIPYMDREGCTTGIKVRMLGKDSKPKYMAYSGSEFGFYNEQHIDKENRSRLIIVEGEFDCMILNQLGYQNVVSVGCGANSLEALLEKEDALLREFDSLVVVPDNDQAGENMGKAFIERYGLQVKLPSVDLYRGHKDITEVYQEKGEASLRYLITSATVRCEGWRDLDSEPYEGMEGLARGRFIPTGLRSIDNALNDLGPGLVTLITGRSNAGKSCIVNAIMANAIDKGNRVLLVAGEGLPRVIINNLYKAVIGRDSQYYDAVPVNKRFFIEPKKEVLSALKRWHKDKLVLFSKGESKLRDMEQFFKLLRDGVKAKHPHLLVIDNLMSCLSVEKASEKLERQADFMQRCCDLAKAENIHIALVVHPNKTLQKESAMDFEQISGSSDLYNKADNIIGVTRYYDPQKIKEQGDGAVAVLKNRLYPDIVQAYTRYQKDTGMLEEIDKENKELTRGYYFRWKRFMETNE